jgi:photosystem II stability/assembly factor-like uncharacterized protein
VAFSGNTGIAVGGSIRTSSDAGANWSDVKDVQNNKCSVKQGTGMGCRLQGVFLTDANTATAVGRLGVIVNTLDGGLSWKISPTDTLLDLNAVTFVDSKEGWVAANARILHTVTGGEPPEF